MLNKLRNFKKFELVVFGLLILFTLFLRVYRIDEYMTFLGDEGRDALVIKRMLTEYDIPLIGPPTSVGNMYLGPLYYYMMAVSMGVVWLNPIAAAVMIAIIGTLTVGLIYYLGKEWFGWSAGLIAAFLYSISPVNIIYSRSSWNPNPAPFFALLAITGFYLSKKKGDYRYLIVTGISLAFSVQMHYLALILVPFLGVLWIYELYNNYKKKNNSSGKFFIIGTSGAVICFLLLMSPLLIFDIKHNYVNFRALSTFFGNRETTVNLNAVNSVDRIWPIFFENLINRYIAGKNVFLASSVTAISFLIVSYLSFIFFKYRRVNWPVFLLVSWIVVGILGLSLYKQTIYDHYIGFLNPAIFLMFGSFFWIIQQLKVNRISKYALRVVFIILIFALVYVNFADIPLKKEPQRQLARTQIIAKYIIKKAEGEPFNFALIAEHNYDAAYQFYLDIYGYKPKQLPFEKTKYLFVVCEDTVCNPVGHPKYEIAAFGWTKIAEEDRVNGLKVYKLISNPEQGDEKL